MATQDAHYTATTLIEEIAQLRRERQDLVKLINRLVVAWTHRIAYQEPHKCSFCESTLKEALEKISS